MIEKTDGKVVIRPACGHILQGTHIERPVHRFRIDWETPYRILTTCAGVPIVWPASNRHAFTLAETEEGAVKIAVWHHGLSGTNFIATRVEKFR
jgi:hypothetical protein